MKFHLCLKHWDEDKEGSRYARPHQHTSQSAAGI